MNILLAKCVDNTLRQNIRVLVPRLKYDHWLKTHFRENDELMVLDEKEASKPGDWVLIKELPENVSLQVKHKVLNVVYQTGNVIDPITGQKAVGWRYAKDIERESSFVKKLQESSPLTGPISGRRGRHRGSNPE